MPILIMSDNNTVVSAHQLSVKLRVASGKPVAPGAAPRTHGRGGRRAGAPEGTSRPEIARGGYFTFMLACVSCRASRTSDSMHQRASEASARAMAS